MSEDAKKAEFPATHVAHWVSGPVPCCEEHAAQLFGLARFLGSHLAITKPAPEGSECENCKNSARAALASAEPAPNLERAVNARRELREVTR